MAIDTNVYTFDPGQVFITAGPIIISAYGDGTFCSVERNGDLFESAKGADGSITRITKNSFDFTVTITITQGSNSNDLLSALYQADANYRTGIVPLAIKDLTGTSTFFARQSWITNTPNMEFGDSPANREWVFATGPAQFFLGGNL